MELQTDVPSTLAECFLDDSHRQQYDIIVVTVTYIYVIGIGAWQTVYAMLQQFLNDITNRNSFNRILTFSKTNNFLKSFHSVLMMSGYMFSTFCTCMCRF